MSRFADHDVESLAVAPPRLGYITLGEWTCGANTFFAIALAPPFLSIHCTELKRLGVHIHTTNMLTDIITTLGHAYPHDLYRAGA